MFAPDNIVTAPDTLRHHPDIIHTPQDNFQTSPESGAHSKSLHVLKGTGRKGKFQILGFNVNRFWPKPFLAKTSNEKRKI